MRTQSPLASAYCIGLVSVIMVIDGMLFAKLGHNTRWSVWIYYAAPTLTTFTLPPIAFLRCFDREQRGRATVRGSV